MSAYSAFSHLAASVCSKAGRRESLFAMVDAQTVYVDDSGSDSMSTIVAAAFCVSTVERWEEFEHKWKKIREKAGFEHFHMTEFAACKRNKWCRECKRGKTTAIDHPWRNWTIEKRENVLKRLSKVVVSSVECGVGISVTKKDYERYIRDSPIRSTLIGPVATDHYVFAIQRCGGSIAEWRAEHKAYPPLRFVFDTATLKQQEEINKVFFCPKEGAQQIEGGLEEWFTPIGISYESRKNTVQLLSADMLAWVSGKIRAAQLYRRGPLNDEAYQVSCVFLRDGSPIKFGYTNSSVLAKFEQDVLAAQEHEKNKQ